MSKFFRRSSDEESSTSESSEDEAPIHRAPARAPAAMLAGYSDSEEETKRVVRTAKDKRFDELKTLVKNIRNSKKIKDMSNVFALFDELCKVFQKAKTVIDRECEGVVPRFYVRYLVELQDFVAESWENRKSLSKPNGKSLSALRQKLRKYVVNFEQDLEEYRASADPEGYSSSQEAAVAVAAASSEDDSESDGEDFRKPTKKPAKKPKAERGSDESDLDSDAEWSDAGEGSSTESLSDLEGKQMEDLRKFFLKKDFVEGVKDEEAVRRRADRRKKAEERQNLRTGAHLDMGEEGWQDVTGRKPDKLKMFDKDAEINHEAVLLKFGEILIHRGKKSADRYALVETLVELMAIADANNLGPAIDAKLYFAIIAGMFEYNAKISDCMQYDSWRRACDYINKLLSLLDDNPHVYCRLNIPESEENFKDETQPMKVEGSLLTLIERLDDEFTKILQHADCHSTDYIDKLKGERDLCDLLNRARLQMEQSGYDYEELCYIYVRCIEHAYYKLDAPLAEDADADAKESGTALLERLCQFVYANDETRRLRQRAVLCHTYHHAMHDRWPEARDLMLMSHLQSTVDHSDPQTQILYNRAICQLGLCAFRHGLIREAHNALGDIQNSQRSKELLAQGFGMRGQDRTPEQEKAEKQRQVPYHMHVNVELMECVYLICSMLLEIPQMASRDYEMRRRMLSRSFHFQLKQSERSSLVGPPENTREHVVAASRAMLAGDWRQCRDFIINERMNAKVWNLFHESERVKQMVVRHIQEESLRTYLMTYSTIYTTVSLNVLAEMFEIEKKSVHAIISKMIIQEDLSATVDEPAECLVMHRREPSRLQLLALQLTEKLGVLADNNDQIIDHRLGSGYGRNAGQSNWFSQRQQTGGQGGPRGLDGGPRDYRGGGQRDYRGGRGRDGGYGRNRGDGGFGRNRDGYNRGGYGRAGGQDYGGRRQPRY